jgi:hypothetical protein
LGAQFERRWTLWERAKRRASWQARPGALLARVIDATETPAPLPFDSAEQLRQVERSHFRAQRLLNRGEARLFTVVERACSEEAANWRVMAQVSLGEILSSPNEAAYRAINSKRVDLLIINANGDPLHAIELQGSGHHLGPAATRDAIKKEALRKAGVGYVEEKPGDTPLEIKAVISKLAAAERCARAV